MTNKSLKEIDKQFDKQKFHDAWAEDESNRIKAFIHKVIAERDEALRKEIQEISNNTYEDTNPFYVLGKVASLLSKE